MKKIRVKMMHQVDITEKSEPPAVPRPETRRRKIPCTSLFKLFQNHQKIPPRYPIAILGANMVKSCNRRSNSKPIWLSILSLFLVCSRSSSLPTAFVVNLIKRRLILIRRTDTVSSWDNVTSLTNYGSGMTVVSETIVPCMEVCALLVNRTRFQRHDKRAAPTKNALSLAKSTCE